MLSRSIGFIAVALAITSLGACSVYDPTLINSGTDDSGVAGSSGSSGFGGFGGDASTIDARVDGSTDDDAGVNLCVPTGDEFCPLSCPETCNDIDDDCDGRVDEASLEPLCQLANAESVCVDAECLLVGCTGTFADCDQRANNGCEVSLASPEHCGSCGRACDIPGATALCIQSTCVFGECLPGFGDCDGDPTNGCELRVDTLVHCGACRVACPTSVPNGTPGCIEGACAVASCEAGFADCDRDITNGCETPNDTTTDCGTCGNTCTFATAAPVCDNGVCAPGECVDGFGDCDGDPSNECEISFESDTLNCGGCGRDCNQLGGPGSSFRCVDNQCVVSNCPEGLGDCDNNGGNGCETSLRTLTDCNVCGRTCAQANAAVSCDTGTCSFVACDTGFGNCDNNTTNGCETPLDTLTNCGTCGTACALANANESCADGTCRVVTCDSGFANCDGNAANGCETSLRTLTNCGTCGSACALANANESCASGSCAITTCDSGFGNCDTNTANGCEQPLNTLNHCASCGTPCSFANATGSCSTGSCVFVACNAGFGNCDGNTANGCETPLNTDTNCGTCNNACATDRTCSGGICSLASCPSGTADCNQDGIDCEQSLSTLPHCGACNARCGDSNGRLPNATASCGSGSCGIGTCDATFGNCDAVAANGCETSLRTTSNCNACGTLCARANATATCATGTCGIGSCNTGFGNCDNNAANGCEQTLNTLTHCGACGTPCSRANASASCASGTCTLGACNAGFGDCDGNPANGCETQLNSTTHCGACNAACGDSNGRLPNSTATCSTGTCAVNACDATFANCDNVASNGCETSLRTLTNCNACGATCSRANATASCTTGTCALSSCNAGFGNCDGSGTNGCETPLNTNTDCGACGTTCAQANATTSCSSGTCQRVSCNAGFGDCDGNPANGCETPLNSLTHCSACNAPCSLTNATQSCTTGTCALSSCNAGFGNCDSITANGCEAALTTTSNCGACGSLCDYANATESCSTGTCTLTGCSSGFGNCDSVTANGCEQALTTLAHCGGCNTPCSRTNASASCTTGTCALGTCNSGFGNCDGNAANGCETTLGTTSNCSACGDVCPDGNPCENFICRGSFNYVTSNVDVTTLDYSSAPTTTLNCGTTTITTTASGATFTNWCGTPPTPLVRTQSSGPAVIVIPLQGLTVNAGNTLLLRGTQPVLLAVLGDVTVHGTIDAGAVATTVGAGGNVNCGTGGGGLGGSDNADAGGGGGGAGFGLNGGNGGGGHNNSSLAFGGPAGGSHGNTSNTPLRGGCPGGRGGTGDNNTPGGGGLGGAGGGGVQISASGRVTVSATGVISASGGGGRHGSNDRGGGGGGSGGAVLVESGGVLSVAAGAWITANGGGGAGGNSSNHGADGTRNNGNRASGGTGASGGGNGGLGGASSGGTTNGTNGGSNDGGGGGGGAVGRIALRGVGGCSVSGSTSPAASQTCP